MDIQPVTNLRILKYVGDDRKAEWAKHFLSEGFKGKEKNSHQPPGKVDFGGIFDRESVGHSNIPSVFGPCGHSLKNTYAPFSFGAANNKNGGKENNALTMTPFFFDSILAVEAMLEKTAGTYSFGDSITMADLALVPQVYNGVR